MLKLSLGQTTERSSFMVDSTDRTVRMNLNLLLVSTAYQRIIQITAAIHFRMSKNRRINI